MSAALFGEPNFAAAAVRSSYRELPHCRSQLSEIRLLGGCGSCCVSHRNELPQFRAALGGRLLDGPVDLGEATVDVRHDAGPHRDPGLDVGGPAGDRDVARDCVGDVGLRARKP
jgi:hypothetical protein